MTEEEKASLRAEEEAELRGSVGAHNKDGSKPSAPPAPQQQSIGEGAHADILAPPHPDASEEEKAKHQKIADEHKKLTDEQKVKLKEHEAQTEKEKEEVCSMFTVEDYILIIIIHRE